MLRRRTMVVVAWAGLSTGALACNAILGDLHAADGGVPSTDAGCGADCLIPIVVPEAGTTLPMDSGITPTPTDSGTVTGDACFPHPHAALPEVKFAAKTCTYEELDTFLKCKQSLQTCADEIPGSCGSCFVTAATGSTWGAFLSLDVPARTGPDPDVTTLTFSDLAGCVAKLDPTLGHPCAQRLADLERCAYEACIAYCPVANAGDDAGLDNLQGCVDQATAMTCAAQNKASMMACAVDTNDAGTGPLDRCHAMTDEVDQNVGADLEIEGYFGLLCGGYDGGLDGGS